MPTIGILWKVANALNVPFAAGNHMLSVGGSLTNGNYTVSSRETGSWIVTPAPLIITATDQSKVYGDMHAFDGTEFSSLGLQNGESVGLVSLSSAGQAKSAAVAGGPYAIAPGNARGGTFDIANYAVTYVNGGLTVRPADIVVSALGGTLVYGTSPLNPVLSATGLKNGEGVSVLTGLSNSFGIANVSNAGNHLLSVAGLLVNPNYNVAGTVTASWIVTPAQLLYVASPAQRYFGDVDPAFSGTVTGFVNGETLGGATTRTLRFTTPATRDSVIGAYAVEGTGLSAGNYVFSQAPGNANALTIIVPSVLAGSQIAPPSGNAGPSGGAVNVSFLPATTTTSPAISFTPATTPTFASRFASATERDIAPASLPDKIAVDSNKLSFEPISIFDANQYSQFQLPSYAAQASRSAIFTMLGRGTLPDQAATIMIDTFWNGTAADIKGTGSKNLMESKVSFSNDAGEQASPDANGFAIEPGKTNIVELLSSGPVIIGGAPGQWLLATGQSPDGKSILANDPVSGKVIAMTLDPTTRALDGVAGFYDPRSKGISLTADLSGIIPSGTTVDNIMDFKAATYIAVRIQ